MFFDNLKTFDERQARVFEILALYNNGCTRSRHPDSISCSKSLNSHNTTSSFGSVASQSNEMNLKCSSSLRKLYSTPYDLPKSFELESTNLDIIDLQPLTLREKELLSFDYSKGRVNFRKSDLSLKPESFGDAWRVAYKEVMKSEYERLSFIADAQSEHTGRRTTVRVTSEPLF